MTARRTQKAARQNEAGVNTDLTVLFLGNHMRDPRDKKKYIDLSLIYNMMKSALLCKCMFDVVIIVRSVSLMSNIL